MDLTAVKSLKGLAGLEHDEFTQTLVNVVYGLAQEVNALKGEVAELKKELENTPTPKS